MLDVAPTEFLLVAFVALVVIGPKDLPKAMRLLGHWVGRARAVGRQFRSGFDEMVREAELAEMEKKWAAENERIMREHPVEHVPSDAAPALPALGDDSDQPLVTVERPHVTPAGPDAARTDAPAAVADTIAPSAAADTKAPS